MPLSLGHIASAATAVAVAAAVLVAAPTAQAAPGAPRTPSRLPSSIEAPARYVAQVSCDPRVRPGTRKLATLLTATYRSARASWASTYACGTDGSRSEHYDGRAVDWMVSIRKSNQRAAAKAAIRWLLATDRAGNRYAMARRLGVMYIIFDNRIWGSWGGGWQQYNGCAKHRSRAYDNSCHRSHVHISLSWNGAMGRTTFWTRRVARTDYGPCRYRGLNWAPRHAKVNAVPCPSLPRAKASKGSSATKKALVRYSGAAVRKGSRGPAVSAVQRATHVPVTGRYDVRTARAVTKFQRKHRVPRTGIMYTATWRALLAAVH